MLEHRTVPEWSREGLISRRSKPSRYVTRSHTPNLVSPVLTFGFAGLLAVELPENIPRVTN
jgi:hypothetical protein